MAGIFKAYDVRGIVPTQLNEEIARKIGLAFQHVLDAEDRAQRQHGGGEPRHALAQRGARSSALIEGLTDAGLDVLDIGLATTPMNYFAIGHLKAAGGVQVTASHNPAQYNGFKFSRHGARPVSGDHGIALMEEKVAGGGPARRPPRPARSRQGERLRGLPARTSSPSCASGARPARSRWWSTPPTAWARSTGRSWRRWGSS